ncbi:MAG: hypothetical protein K6T16_01555 [Candidatus Pacearchaeota archaeon]|nr:hypothetical protein [Candidatus Pacearchaeota archaeon]
MAMAVNLDRGQETFDYELYDTVTLATGTNRFFGNTEASQGSAITNMQQPNLLPVGQIFRIHEIAFAGDSDISLASAKALIKNTVLKLFINNKQYFTALCFRLPAGGGLYGSDSAGALAVNGNPSAVSTYRFKRVLVIDSSTPFYVEVIADAGANTLRGRVILRGLLTRPVG